MLIITIEHKRRTRTIISMIHATIKVFGVWYGSLHYTSVNLVITRILSSFSPVVTQELKRYAIRYHRQLLLSPFSLFCDSCSWVNSLANTLTLQ